MKLGKSIEDLQRDLFSVNDDCRALEMLLKGERITTWNEIEDHMLMKNLDFKSYEF